ncbi:MAG: hypothetical protein COB53_05090 [Elusimicrobia bacterium]|nr:MAG: hypothetical protein COB53_05090 [Elusimicrobiota bacterium]
MRLSSPLSSEASILLNAQPRQRRRFDSKNPAGFLMLDALRKGVGVQCARPLQIFKGLFDDSSKWAIVFPFV